MSGLSKYGVPFWSHFLTSFRYSVPGWFHHPFGLDRERFIDRYLMISSRCKFFCSPDFSSLDRFLVPIDWLIMNAINPSLKWEKAWNGRTQILRVAPKAHLNLNPFALLYGNKHFAKTICTGKNERSYPVLFSNFRNVVNLYRDSNYVGTFF